MRSGHLRASALGVRRKICETCTTTLPPPPRGAISKDTARGAFRQLLGDRPASDGADLDQTLDGGIGEVVPEGVRDAAVDGGNLACTPQYQLNQHKQKPGDAHAPPGWN
jgi:hypothetical protein